MKRGEVWRSALDPTVGHELQRSRPCVIISPPEIHDHLRIALIAPLTSGSRPAPYRIETTFGGRAGLILLEQIRVLDQRRIYKRLGELDPLEFARVLAGLTSLFAP